MARTSSLARATSRLGKRRALALAGIVAALVTSGTLLGSLTSSPATGATKGSGSVNVLYAGSLLDLMQHQIDPAFHRATGYSVNGFSNESSVLATEISAEAQVGDVFISASPAVNSSLEGTANGNWVSSYDEFGTSALVLGYNQNSKFAKDLEKLPWFDVVDRAGFRLGRTNPSIDSKGVLSVDALTGVALSYGVPDLGTLAVSSSNIFSGASLVSELQAGQLDAGFFYGVEASTAHIKTVPLVGTHLVVQYTVAMLNRAPHESGAKAFVRFLLGPVGRQILKANGVNTINPAKVVTATTSVTTNTTIPITTNTTTTNTGPPTTDTTVP